jgi:hypothetical protein
LIIESLRTLANSHGHIIESEIVEVIEMYAQGGLTSFDTIHIYGFGEGILRTFSEQWAKEKEHNDVFHDVHV